MALVKLKNDWFAPDGGHYRKADHGVEVPDHLVKQLPSTAKLLKSRPKIEVVEEDLKDADPERAAGNAYADAHEAAEKARQANAERLRKQLAKEKA